MGAFDYKCPERETIEPEIERRRIDDLYEGERYMKVRFLLPTLMACYFIPVHITFRPTECNLHEVGLSYRLQAGVEPPHS